MNKEVQVFSTTLDCLLNKAVENIEGNQQLIIPEYQRPYVWGEEQVIRLLKDLKAYFIDSQDGEPLYYLGNIILHQTSEGLNIIDGQQRLTTLLLLAKLCDIVEDTSIKYINSLSIKQIRSNYLLVKSIFDMKYHRYSYLEKLKDKMDYSKINVTLIITDKEDLAYTFFETINTGGIRLSGSDIVKAHHLRAVLGNEKIAFQARRWEEYQGHVDEVIKLLVKIRYWKNYNWKEYPKSTELEKIRNSIIDEFSVQTKNGGKDISYYSQIIEKWGEREVYYLMSRFKEMRQSLSDGDNTLDYLNEYIKLYVDLFVSGNHIGVDKRFYDFYNKLVKDRGSIFLIDLWKTTVMVFVSRFGFIQLFEISMWLYRNIYSLRVYYEKSVREDSVYKYVKDNKIIDMILCAYSVPELILELREKEHSTFNTSYNGETHEKGKHVSALHKYFGTFQLIGEYKNDSQFDHDLIQGINNKLMS